MYRPPYNSRPNPGDPGDHRSPHHRSPQTRQQQQQQQPATQPPPPPQKKKTPAFEAGPVRLVENAGALKAYLSVKIGSLTIHKFRVIQQPGQAPWVSVPQETWTDPQTGERRFTNLLELPCEWRQPLTNAVIAAWQEELHKQEGARQ